MNKHRVVAAGHICLDITPVFPMERQVHKAADLLVPGKLIEMSGVSVHTGGSVANTGLALKLLGNEVCLLGKVGDDAFGAMVRDILQGYGAGGLIVDKDSSTSYSVVLAMPGLDRIFLHNPGANNTFSASDIPGQALEEAELFHFGYPPLMERMYRQDGAEMVHIFRRVKEMGIATSLDMAAVDPQREAGKLDWQKILQNVLPYVDFFLPSFEELCFMLNRPLYEKLAAENADMTRAGQVEVYAADLAGECLRMGCGVAVIKCGLAGMVYASSGRERMERVGRRIGLKTDEWACRKGLQRCFRAETVLSGTGAGDVSIAAFLTAVLAGEDAAMCVALAAAEGAASVTSYDALGGIRSLDELKAKIKAGWQQMEGKDHAG